MYAEKIVELLSSDNKEFLRVLNESKGFCIPHFVTLVQMSKDVAPTRSQKIIKTIIKIEEKNLRKLASELTEYIRKQSHEFSEKDRLTVADIVPRSVEKIAGRRGTKLKTIERVRR